jgi:hypothetical protein
MTKPVVPRELANRDVDERRQVKKSPLALSTLLSAHIDTMAAAQRAVHLATPRN